MSGKPDGTETLRRLLTAEQGLRCFFCSEPWTEMAHIEPSGMGGRDNRTVSNLIGCCRFHHDVLDGRRMDGRQRMLRDLVKEAKASRRRARL